DFVSYQKFIFSIEDLVLKPSMFQEDNVVGKAGGIAYRLAKTILLDGPVDVWIGTANHEYFGHGWRLREYGFTRNGYYIGAPPPYGNGGGFTYPGNGYYTTDEDIAMRIAGVQANSTISEELRNVFLETGKIHYRQAFAYIGGVSDVIQYILRTSRIGYPYGDMAYYTALVQERNAAINLGMLKSNVLLNFANPFLFYSLYSFFDRYLVYGEGEVSYPMIHVFDFQYLPSFRFGLTPFGAEIRLENLVNTASRVYNVYIGYDGFGHFTSLRLGIQVEHIFKNDLFDIGGTVEVWDQPLITLSSHTSGSSIDEESSINPVQGSGGMLSAHARIHPFSPDWGVYLETGYKTVGFTEKEQLAGGLILRGGVTIRK
ncbi:MAG: hypothetical protein ACHQM6_05660, partial [Candidatus Kapaibacterium sp.]